MTALRAFNALTSTSSSALSTSRALTFLSAAEIGGTMCTLPRDLGQERAQRRGGLPDARVGAPPALARAAAEEEAPLARRLGVGEGEEVLYVIYYENLTL